MIRKSIVVGIMLVQGLMVCGSQVPEVEGCKKALSRSGDKLGNSRDDVHRSPSQEMRKLAAAQVTIKSPCGPWVSSDVHPKSPLAPWRNDCP